MNVPSQPLSPPIAHVTETLGRRRPSLALVTCPRGMVLMISGNVYLEAARIGDGLEKCLTGLPSRRSWSRASPTKPTCLTLRLSAEVLRGNNAHSHGDPASDGSDSLAGSPEVHLAMGARFMHGRLSPARRPRR